MALLIEQPKLDALLRFAFIGTSFTLITGVADVNILEYSSSNFRDGHRVLIILAMVKV